MVALLVKDVASWCRVWIKLTEWDSFFALAYWWIWGSQQSFSSRMIPRYWAKAVDTYWLL